MKLVPKKLNHWPFHVLWKQCLIRRTQDVGSNGFKSLWWESRMWNVNVYSRHGKCFNLSPLLDKVVGNHADFSMNVSTKMPSAVLSGGQLACNMMTSSNGNIFHVTGHLCGEFTGPGELPTQRPVTRSFDVFFDLRLNKRLSKQSWGW